MENFLTLILTMISWAGSALVNKWPIWGIIHRLIGNPSDTFNLSFEDWNWNKHPLPQSTMNRFPSSLRIDISDCWSCLKQMGGGQSANLQDKFPKNELIGPNHAGVVWKTVWVWESFKMISAMEERTPRRLCSWDRSPKYAAVYHYFWAAPLYSLYHYCY